MHETPDGAALRARPGGAALRERPGGAALRGRPGGAALLDEARRVLLEELLPALPEESRYAARMVAAAMAIAARDARADHRAEAELLHRLGGGGGPEALARLCREIRSGQHDPGSTSHAAIHAWLDAYVRLRLAISNPRGLTDDP